LIAISIIVTTAATLNKAGIKDIATSAQAAQALKPIAANLLLSSLNGGRLAILFCFVFLFLGVCRWWDVKCGRTVGTLAGTLTGPEPHNVVPAVIIHL
jgi:hypothetical protein